MYTTQKGELSADEAEHVRNREQALVDLPQNHWLFESLVALVFFGAPHRGLQIDALSDYTWNCLRQSRAKTIVGELGSGSAWLKVLHKAFLDRLDYMPHIISIYETVATAQITQSPMTGK